MIKFIYKPTKSEVISDNIMEQLSISYFVVKLVQAFLSWFSS